MTNNNNLIFIDDRWVNANEVYPHVVYCPSATLASHQDKWQWIVHTMNLKFHDDWLITCQKEDGWGMYDYWQFKDAGAALMFQLKWSNSNTNTGDTQ